MRKKVDPKRIERLEAFARSRRIEDAKKRHLEAFSKMSEEEVASAYLALKQIQEEEDPRKGDTLFKSGLATIEHLEERGKLGWQRYCETGAQAAVVNFCEAIDGEGSSVTMSSQRVDFGILFEGPKPSSSRLAGIRFHFERLASESEKKALSERLRVGREVGR